jgi:nitroimidazol reductase NimA-like FMN-containing flavoprotein (pyridoxamine 5'-phosphate oxidase superfamily)
LRPCADATAWRTIGDVSNYGLKVLDRDECAALLGTQRIGRVGMATPEPLVLPVEYALLDGDVVFRTAPGEKLIAAVMGRTVAFEIDEYDVTARTGWSVVVVGTAEEVVGREELTRVEALGLHPWSGELRDRYVRIHAEEISGRRIDPAI